MNRLKLSWITLCLGLFVAFQSNAQPFAPQPTQAPDDKDKISLEDIWLYYKFFPRYPAEFNWMEDDNFYTVFEDDKIEKYSIEDQKPVATILDLKTVKDPDSGDPVDAKSYTFSKGESKLLLKTEVTPIYRRSTKEVCYAYDLERKKVYKLQDGENISFCTFSPDGSKLAYVFKNNLYLFDLDRGKATQVTKDGEWNNIIYGGTDWVYEEEFAFAKAFHWSPDGSKLALYRFDESDVKEFTMDYYGSLYPKQYKFKYPKAGEDNAKVSIHIYNLSTGSLVKADLGKGDDIYVPRIKWTSSSDQLAVMRMNRLQNTLDLMLVNSGTGESKIILKETEETYIDEVTDEKWMFLKDGSGFIWQSEADGFNHLYLHDMEGKLIRQLTKGEWEVKGIASIDEEKKMIYFMSTLVNPFSRHLCSVGFNGKKIKRLTKLPGWHDITFSSNNSYYMDSHSAIDSPPRTALYSIKGDEILVLEENNSLKETIARYQISQPSFFKFKTSDNIFLDGWMIKPPNFDETKKYPVLIYTYGGPGSQTVKNQWLGFNYFWHQMLASDGYIVISVDGRGTGGKGEEFKKITYAQLGKYETQDMIETAKWLQKQGYVDKDRIGIWGWSFGGYLSSLCITKGGEFFKMAIAVAPVTNWRFYDTIYTERYLKTPQENKEGYDDNSPIYFAKDLDGAYLLVHGTADDNVHYQNSLEWVDALVKANKQFDMAFYPNRNHGIFGGMTRLHLYQKMTDFIKENL